MSKLYYFYFVSVFFFTSCANEKRVISKVDYEAYLKGGIVSKEINMINKEIDFWQEKLKVDTGSYVYLLELANNYFRLFKRNGDIEALQKGDACLKKSSAKLKDTDADILFSLSQNAVLQHQFLKADSINKAADIAQGDKYIIKLLEFDVNMELGRYKEAEMSLESLKDKTSFDYLIRKSKWEDYKGDLDAAILLMEQALEKIKDKNQGLYGWALSNLADMYGHAARINEAYRGYLKVLQKDSTNFYCLKGIAWIAFAHDGNTAEAKRILQFILSQTNMPDVKLILAQIAEIENNEIEKKKNISEFVATVTKPGYGDMYNKYLIELYTEELQEQNTAFEIANKEMNNRFTPETCDWMAWVYYNKGDIRKALQFSKSYVHQFTFEPDALMHTAFIYAANGKNKEAKALLQECLQSSFELGPVATKQINQKLQTL